MTASRIRAVAILLVGIAAAADAAPPQGQTLGALSIEQLMEIDVTLGTRQLEPLRTIADAIGVVTAEDIRRSGVTTIGDAIALADGINVARFNNGSWAISARGFNATSANKLLVMVDGRIEYSPLFSGTFWNMLDYVLEDIERIEVIRGPGATLWGGNAVNGVVNIITRHSRDTQGTFVALASGNEDPLLADVRYGGTAGTTTYRVYAKHARRDDQVLSTGASAGDARRRGQVGFRIDGGQEAGDSWLFKGDAFHSRDDLLDRSPGEFTELALQGRWSRTLAAESRLDVQSYYRHEYRRVPQQLTHAIDTIDVDLQHAFRWNLRHRVVWGARYRFNTDDTSPGVVAFEPAERTYPIFEAFVQDEIALRPDRFYLTAGIKAGHNSFSGAEWQPTLRARAQFGPRQMVWGAVSGAIRRPTRLDVDVRAFAPDGTLLAVGGGESYRAETLVAGEAGYRVQPRNFLAFDATVFLNDYDHLRSQDLPPTGFPIVVGNTLEGRAHGLEFATRVYPMSAWRMHLTYTYLNLAITRAPGSRDIGLGASEANDPRHQFAFNSAFDLPHRIELDTRIRRVGALPNPVVPAYTELNFRAGWHATPRVEMSITGQDLLHAHHPEFGAAMPQRIEFERSLRATVTFRYP